MCEDVDMRQKILEIKEEIENSRISKSREISRRHSSTIRRFVRRSPASSSWCQWRLPHPTWIGRTQPLPALVDFYMRDQEVSRDCIADCFMVKPRVYVKKCGVSPPFSLGRGRWFLKTPQSYPLSLTLSVLPPLSYPLSLAPSVLPPQSFVDNTVACRGMLSLGCWQMRGFGCWKGKLSCSS